MKRAAYLYFVVLICLAASPFASGQSNGKKEKVCSFNINGTWKSDATPEGSPMIFSFSPEGHVTLFTPSADALPQDFEVLTSVAYKLDKPAAPKRLDFTASRGNDIFQRGVTSLKIIEYGDNNFTTLDRASGHKARWERLQTHVYFLTFAARTGPLPQDAHAFAMWTLMDGRKTDIDALGVQMTKDDAGKILPVFGAIPAEIYEKLTEADKDKKSDKDDNVFMRLELTEAEFETTRDLYQVWDKYVKTRALPNEDPYLNAMEFMKKVAASLNQCDEKVKLLSLGQRARDEIVPKNNLPQLLLEYVKAMRKMNDDIHVSNRVFPWNWRPMIQAPGQ
jgi:hypothetical protein